MNLSENTCPESEKLEAPEGLNEKPGPLGRTPNLEAVKRRKLYKLEWARNHPESVQKSNRKQFLKNLEARRAYGRQYHNDHREQRREYARLYHKKHYAEHRERLLAQTKEYAQHHPEIRRKIFENYRAKHPEKYKAHTAASHAKRKAAMRGATHVDPKANGLILRWRLQKRFICYYCGTNLPTNMMHVDHIVPVTKGGKHEVGNLCRSCPACNIRKRNHPVGSVVVNGQRFLNI